MTEYLIHLKHFLKFFLRILPFSTEVWKNTGAGGLDLYEP